MKTKYIFRLLLTICFFSFGIISCQLKPSGEKESNIEKAVVWKKGENNVEGYRIPGIVVTAKGTVLAFAEERPVFGDADPKSMVLKRSVDGAQTWSENIYIEKCDGNYWKNHSAEIDPRDVKDKKEVWTNVAPIVDKQTGRIFFFYALNEGKIEGKNLQRYTKVFYKFSDDDGISWSDRVEITDLLNAKKDGTPNKDLNGNWNTDINGLPCDYLGRAFHMPGPGHGIQLSNGRLLLQVWNRKALGSLEKGEVPVTEREYGVCTICSDDHGETWQYGSAFGHDGLNMNESRMAELSNGDVYMNSRYVPTEPGNRNNHRIVATSRDGGENWVDIRVDINFPVSNHCDAGLVALKYQDKNLLLYSKNESVEGRKNLVIKLSYDEGKTWPVSKVIDKGSAWYSDLAVLPDNTILLLYETGKNSPVYCVRINISWLEDA